MSNNLPWFKLYADARLDKKLGILTLAERGVWVNLLCYASEQSVRGAFDATDRYTLAMECADGDEAVLASTIEKLIKVRHIVPCNEHVTSDLSLQRYMFRTFEARQAQKVSNFPSDAPERVKARVAKHRASHKQPPLRNGHVTSVTSGNDTDRDIEREVEVDSPLSGKVISLAAVVAESTPSVSVEDRPSAAAATASEKNHWTPERAKRTAEEVARKIRLPLVEIPDLIDFIQACPLLSHELIIPEAISYRSWLNKNRKGAEPRVFYNKWLIPANDRREMQRVQQQSALQNNGHSNGLNGYHSSSNGKGSTSNGTTQQGTLDPTKDPEHLKRHAYLVQQRGQRQVTG